MKSPVTTNVVVPSLLVVVSKAWNVALASPSRPVVVTAADATKNAP